MHKFFLSFSLFSANLLLAVSDAGNNSASLDQAIANEAINGGVINFSSNVLLYDGSRPTQVRAFLSAGDFTAVSGASVTVNGNNSALLGNNQTRGFFVGANGTDGVVNINSLNFSGCRAQGGNGASGGMGSGGALYIANGAVVTCNNCVFNSCSAIGGNGGSVPFIGGGGLHGDSTGLGGGGFGGAGNNNGGGGCSGFTVGDADGSSPGGNFAGSRNPSDSGVGGQTGPGNFGGGGGSLAGGAAGGRYGGGGSSSTGGGR